MVCVCLSLFSEEEVIGNSSIRRMYVQLVQYVQESEDDGDDGNSGLNEKVTVSDDDQEFKMVLILFGGFPEWRFQVGATST